MRFTLWRQVRRMRRPKILVLFVILSLAGVAFLLALLSKDPKLNYEEYNDVLVQLKSKHTNQREYIDKKGMHVVVGHYVGEELPGRSAPNLTNEILDTNEYLARPGAGDNGMPVIVPSFEGTKMELLYRINSFNLIASDRIALNRSLPDVRKKKCQEKSYSIPTLPTTSVIIVFHNEAWSTLLRTVHSVIDRSPNELLREIILVDDASERSFLRKPLEEHISKLSIPVRLIRTEFRSGLIRARLLGAQEAKGDILTFLDAHCETTKGWLEPLLHRIAEDRTRVVCPIIDIISDNTFQYIRSFALHWGAFNWNLHYRWYSLGRKQLGSMKKDPTEAYWTPAMAGGLFSINKDFFYQIGAYDRLMDIWGGENLEMSFRVWMCGGSVETVPCSHVGHVFRKSSPYTFPGEGGVGGVLYRNLARVALVWMDEWGSFFFKMNPEAARASKNISVSDRKMLRERLNCHNFEWYLKNVWQNHFFPTHDGFFGKIRHYSSDKCLQRPPSPGDSHPVGTSRLKNCVIETYAEQSFVFNKDGLLMTDESVCLDAPDSEHATEPQVMFIACNELERQKWKYDDSSQQIIHYNTSLCLDLPSKSRPETLSLQKCSKWTRSQRWLLEKENWTKIRV